MEKGEERQRKERKSVRDKDTEEMKGSAFWDITLCSPLKTNRRIGGTCCLQLLDRGVSQSRNQHETGSNQRSADFQRTIRRYISEDRTTITTAVRSLDPTLGTNYF
jgi:hypothetical protein